MPKTRPLGETGAALRGLTHYAAGSLAVLLAAAVASAVLTGALLTGDSVRGSLRSLVLDRLGRFDKVLVSEGFFREELSDEVSKALQASHASAPFLVARGSATHGTTGARASKVMVLGIDDRFAKAFGPSADVLAMSPLVEQGAPFPPVVLARALANELGAAAGDDVLLTFAQVSELPRETVLAGRNAEDLLASRRFRVAQVVADRGPGGFTLTASQQAARNAWVPLSTLQRDLKQPGRVNAIVTALATPSAGALPENLWRGLLRPEDFGLRLVTVPTWGGISIESREYFLKPAATLAIEDLAKAPSTRVLTYLATKLTVPGRVLPYSLISGLSRIEGSGLESADGGPLPPLADGEVLLNDWAAEDLGISPRIAAGAPPIVGLEYLVAGSGAELVTKTASLTVRGVVKMAGLGADRTLTPEFPGIANARNIADWDPPFPVDHSLVRPKDEDYWHRYGAAPKAFVSEATARRLFANRFGDVTSVRVTGPADELAKSMAETLPKSLPLAPYGLVFRDLREQGLKAASGATDFAGLFLAFSVFLIVAAVLLTGLLFGLGVERRAGEIGALLAMGFPARVLRRRLLIEGGALVVLGVALGIGLGIGYASLVMWGLRTLWRPAVGTSELGLHVEAGSAVLGALLSIAVVGLAIVLTTRRLSKLPIPALLAGETRGPEAEGREGRVGLSDWTFRLATGAAIAFLAAAIWAGRAGMPGLAPILAFGIGASTLIAGLANFSRACRRGRLAQSGKLRFTLAGLAARSASVRPGRSLLCVALIASASFVLVTVSANRSSGEGDGSETPPGAGGFSLVAESDIPILHDLNSAAGREALGLSEANPDELRGVRVFGLRARPGEDASCLNLYKPTQPRLLGFPDNLLSHAAQAGPGGFAFQSTLPTPGDAKSPWSLLTQTLGENENIVPAFADANSAQWILHLGLGQDLEFDNESGKRIRIRLVGLLSRSLFQSELLISEANLLAHFPSRAGKSFFLIETPPGRAKGTSDLLESRLSRFGFDATPTARRLADFHAVENTYLSTFQVLGGLGLLLGTLGLGVILLRNVLERRGELATLRAMGFRSLRLAALVTLENAVLLVWGLALGTVAGLLAVFPRILETGAGLAWGALALTLGAVLASGLLACLAAVRNALSVPLLGILKAER